MAGKYTIQHICTWLDAQCNFAFPNEEIQRLSIDSRNLYEAKNTLFIAIKGDNHNGHNYIPQLVEAGVKNFLISESRYAQLYEANFILVPNTLDALQKIAAKHRAQFTIPVVGITGSLGKTVIKEWLAHMLDGSEKVVRSPRSYNSQVGVPLSVWQMQAEHSIALFEAGISMPGEMAKLKNSIEPNVGIFSNLGDPHSENFENAKHKAIEKAQLFTDCKSIVYCADSTIITEALDLVCPQVQKIAWGNTTQASMQLVSKTMGLEQCEVELLWKEETLRFTIPFSDSASIENACHCIALLLHLGKAHSEIQLGLMKLNPVAMRLEMKRGMHNALLINDVYTSDLASLEIALDVLHRQQKQGEKTLILSDILQSDKNENDLYSELGLLLKRYNIQHFIGIGKALERNESHILIADARFYENTQACLRNLHQHNFRNQAILLKGARPFQLEKISQQLEERLHETRLEIDLNAVVHNLNYYRSLLSTETKIMAVIKASSYGSGGVEMASLLQHQGVDYLAVAFADEGIELREAGIRLPIVVLNPESKTYDHMIRYRLEPEIFSFRVLESFCRHLRDSGSDELPYPVHLKLDTGMNRLGFTENDIESLLYELQLHPEIKVASIFSHLAASEDPMHDVFTQKQIASFGRMSKQIETKLGYVASKHILNSSGITRHPKGIFDLVRLGIGLHGIGAQPQEQDRLHPVSTFKSKIVQIKEVPKGESVGYGRMERMHRNGRIATVCVGYADGLRRSMGNRNSFLMVNGQKASIVGNVCMDVCMIDISEIDAHVGDDVLIFGAERPVQGLAKELRTIAYEVLTSIPQRVKRIYYQE